MVVAQILQVILAAGLFNVWLVRPGKETGYRGGKAKSLKEEFAVYGLPGWFHSLIGVLKIGSALGLLIGLYIPGVALASAGLLIGLMVGALAMHIKVKDPINKSIPALLMLGMALIVVVTSPAL